MTICIVGIDCATDIKKVGLARGYFSENNLSIDRISKPAIGQSVCDAVVQWIDIGTTTLLALDAPLGWPESLGADLSSHSAGAALPADSNLLFRRETDRFVKREINKQSLDVGADRIARTAHAALKYLNEISLKLGQEVPLAWTTSFESNVSAIEVYPAATLKQSGIRSSGYKKRENVRERKQIFDALCENIKFDVDAETAINDDDLLDAAVWVLAGRHFLSNQSMQPCDLQLAKKEGWIWVKEGEEM